MTANAPELVCDHRVDLTLSPAKAIRAKCLQCVGECPSEVRNCSAQEKDCHLWPYRMGEGYDGSRPFTRLSRIKAIRAECIHCMGGCYGTGRKRTASDLVRGCEADDCPLWSYREGKNPNRRLKNRRERPYLDPGDAIAGPVDNRCPLLAMSP